MSTTNIRTVGVIGVGQMGRGICQVFTQSGYSVIAIDHSETALAYACELVEKALLRDCEKGNCTHADVSAAMAGLTWSQDLTDIANCDLVIESATENEETKIKIFEALRPYLRAHTILATNTSSLSVTRLAACTDRPERFIGLHFMNPVPKMNLVEIIRGLATQDDIYNTLNDVVTSLGKTSTTSQDFPAFIVNRILIPVINEAIYVLFEGVGTVASIDASMKLGANHPMGPLQLADFIGLDTCLAIMNVLYDGFGDPKYRPCPLLVQYVGAGWLGRKKGRGFYDYSQTLPVPSK